MGVTLRVASPQQAALHAWPLVCPERENCWCTDPGPLLTSDISVCSMTTAWCKVVVLHCAMLHWRKKKVLRAILCRAYTTATTACVWAASVTLVYLVWTSPIKAASRFAIKIRKWAIGSLWSFISWSLEPTWQLYCHIYFSLKFSTASCQLV